MHSCRKSLPLALLMLVSASSPSLAADPSCQGGGVSGTITFTEKKLSPAQAGDAKLLKTEQRCTINKEKSGDEWDLYLVANLSRVAGAEQVNIVFYDQASGQPEKPGNEVNSFPINTKKDTKTVIAELEISRDAGFKVGGKYSVVITRLVSGREEIYARTTLELK